MKRLDILTAIVFIFMLTACGGSSSTGTPTALAPDQYQGITLLQPEPIKAFPTQPPPAWLIVNSAAIPATYFSFCYQGCLDMEPPQQLPRLATAGFPPGERLIVIIDAATIKTVQARVGAWTTVPSAPFDPAKTHDLPTEVKQDNRFAVVTLAPLQDSGTQLLAIEATFTEGQASYLWRLNPIK
jgi:hypothetical protein